MYTYLGSIFPPKPYLDLPVHALTTALPATQRCCASNKKGKCVFWTENRSPTRLVSFNMQKTQSALRGMESSASFVLVVMGGLGVGGAIHQISVLAQPRLLSFSFFFSWVSQPCLHYPLSSSIMVQGLLNFFSPGTEFRKIHSYSRTRPNDC